MNQTIIQQLERLRELAEKATPEPQLSRYEHGGGRLTKEHDKGRTLVADFYDEANREFYCAAGSTLTPSRISALIDALKALETIRDNAGSIDAEVQWNIEPLARDVAEILAKLNSQTP